MPAAQEIARALNGLARRDRGRLLAALVRRLGDLQLAEDSLQDAFQAALERWAQHGVPQNTMGWLLRVAERKGIDRLRRESRWAEKAELLAAEWQAPSEDVEAIPDERLALIFTCCHPALEAKSRIALTLRTLGGLSTGQIARAFLDREATMGQRISRAKKKIAAARIPFGVPGPDLWAERLHSVLNVIYLIFNEGYSAGDESVPVRASLCEEAVFLARLIDALRAGEQEVEGLIALMLFSYARRHARLDSAGAWVPLNEQDVAAWDTPLIEEGEAYLDRAVGRLGTGRFQIQAAIHALHIQGGQRGETDWRQILLLYNALHRLEPTPVVALNRLVVFAEVHGTEAALQRLSGLAEALSDYQPFHAASAALFARADRGAEARAAYTRAIRLSQDIHQTRYLERCLAGVSG